MVATPKTRFETEVPLPSETQHQRKIRRRDCIRLVLIAAAVVALMMVMAWLARWAGVPIPIDYPFM